MRCNHKKCRKNGRLYSALNLYLCDEHYLKAKRDDRNELLGRIRVEIFDYYKIIKIKDDYLNDLVTSIGKILEEYDINKIDLSEN